MIKFSSLDRKMDFPFTTNARTFLFFRSRDCENLEENSRCFHLPLKNIFPCHQINDYFEFPHLTSITVSDYPLLD